MSDPLQLYIFVLDLKVLISIDITDPVCLKLKFLIVAGRCKGLMMV
jgi:hypothetical protein